MEIILVCNRFLRTKVREIPSSLRVGEERGENIISTVDTGVAHQLESPTFVSPIVRIW